MLKRLGLTSALFIAATWFVGTRQGAAQTAWLEHMAIAPPEEATTQDIVEIALGGTWANSCAPNTVSHRVTNNSIELEVSYPGIEVACLQVITDWELTHELGALPAGTYRVTGSLFAINPFDPSTTPRLVAGPDSLLESYSVSQPVPEPSTVVLFTFALIGLFAQAIRRKNYTV